MRGSQTGLLGSRPALVRWTPQATSRSRLEAFRGKPEAGGAKTEGPVCRAATVLPVLLGRKRIRWPMEWTKPLRDTPTFQSQPSKQTMGESFEPDRTALHRQELGVPNPAARGEKRSSVARTEALPGPPPLSASRSLTALPRSTAVEKTAVEKEVKSAGPPLSRDRQHWEWPVPGEKRTSHSPAAGEAAPAAICRFRLPKIPEFGRE
jgi:hypothetical protein